MCTGFSYRLTRNALVLPDLFNGLQGFLLPRAPESPFGRQQNKKVGRERNRFAHFFAPRIKEAVVLNRKFAQISEGPSTPLLFSGWSASLEHAH
jgi:hypothetical protein